MVQNKSWHLKCLLTSSDRGLVLCQHLTLPLSVALDCITAHNIPLYLWLFSNINMFYDLIAR